MLFIETLDISEDAMIDLFDGNIVKGKLHVDYLYHHRVLVLSPHSDEYRLSFAGRDLLRSWSDDTGFQYIRNAAALAGGGNFKMLLELIDEVLKRRSGVFPSDGGCFVHEGTVEHIHTHPSAEGEG